MVKNILFIAFIFVVSLFANAQQSRCLIDYKELKTEIVTYQDYTVGSVLRIRPEYLYIINNATREDYQYFSYKKFMRPANSTERSLTNTVSSFETVENGNVYKNEITFLSYGFFKEARGFKGKYDLEQGFEKSNLVPYGLYPADFKSISNKPLHLRKITRQYLLFDVGTMKIVYFRNEMLPLYDVFEYDSNRAMISGREQKYDFLTDRRVKISRQAKPIFVRMQNMTDFSQSIDDEFECTISSVKCYADHTILKFRDQYDIDGELMVDSQSDFLMHNSLCLEGKDEMGDPIKSFKNDYGCRIGYAGLKKKLEEQDNEMRRGTLLYVKSSYIDAIVKAKSSDYRYFGYYEYMRPANSTEKSLGLTSSYFHKIINGHVYKDELTFSSNGFFKIGKGFGGKFNLMTNGENTNHVPFGLFPKSVYELENIPLKLISISDEFVVLDRKGKRVIYYRNPELPLDEVFEDVNFRKMIGKKRNHYLSLRNKKVRLIAKKQKLLIRSQNMNIFIPYNGDQIEFVIDDIICYPDYSILTYRDKYGANYSLYIDSKSDFDMYDGDCMGQKEEMRRILVEDASSRIDQYAKGLLPMEGLRSDTATLKALFMRFNLIPDKKTGIRWYNHKNQSMKENLMSKYLKLTCTKEGHSYLMSMFAGSDRLYHNAVTVTMGEQIITSETIPSSDHDNVYVIEPNSGQVWETVHFTNGRDNGIIELIAQNTDQKIGVRFIGARNSDFVLSDKHKNAIRDTYVLSAYLKMNTINKSNVY